MPDMINLAIAGVDETVSPQVLRELSEYAWPLVVEWGILCSTNNMGQQLRYPSRNWVYGLAQECEREQPDLPHSMTGYTGMQIALHLCGKLVLDFCNSTPEDWTELYPGIWPFVHRVQLNYHGYSLQELNYDRDRFRENKQKLALQERVLIIPKGKDVKLFETLLNDADGCIVDVLHDMSGGLGIETPEWQAPVPHHFNGYAGGLKLDTIVEHRDAIRRMQPYYPSFYLDLESGSRDASNCFDAGLVRSIIDALKDCTKKGGNDETK